MEVLLTGNTEYITPAWVEAAFPKEHIVITSFPGAGSAAGAQAVTLDSPAILEKLMETYEFERIVYFSEYLTPHAQREGELDWLRRILQMIREKPVQFLYITGPECVMTPATGKAIIARAAELLCRHYAANSKAGIKVLHLGYLYSVNTAAGLQPLFEKAAAGHISFDEKAESGLCAVCADDAAELVLRIFDSWQPGFEAFTAPIGFKAQIQDLGKKLEQLFPGVQVDYGEDTPKIYPADTGEVRRRFGWFAHYNILDDLGETFALWQKEQNRGQTAFARFVKKLTGQKKALAVIEILCAWLVTEALVLITGTQAQFRMVDFRLAFIMIAGTVYGLNAGIFAAALGSASLVFGYMRQGTAPILLFYDPGNWLAFIVYFVVGAVCGYVQLNHAETVRFVQTENAQARERLQFVQRLYNDALEDKRLFRRQILGRKDSFGKIYAVTQQLNEIEPQKLYHRTVRVMADVLQNQTLALYQVDPNQKFARRMAASPAFGESLPRSIELSGYQNLIEETKQNGVWVNRALTPDMPSYACAVRSENGIAVLIFLHKAEEDQFSLYYQNLFRILCGLVENSLMRAFEYENTAKSAMYLPGSRVLRKAAFAEKLAAVCALQEDKMAQHLLVRVLKPADPPLFSILEKCVRASDLTGIAPDGTVCILMLQAGSAELPIVRNRLAASGIEIEVVPFAVQLDWLAEEKEGSA